MQESSLQPRTDCCFATAFRLNSNIAPCSSLPQRVGRFRAEAWDAAFMQQPSYQIPEGASLGSDGRRVRI